MFLAGATRVFSYGKVLNRYSSGYCDFSNAIAISSNFTDNTLGSAFQRPHPTFLIEVM